MSRPGVKLALVGCGGIAGAHVKGYADLWARGCREFEIAACCDVSREAAAARAREIAAFQGREPAVFTEVADLVKAGAAEAADLCTPHHVHHTAGVALLEGGWHVLCEKPLGLTVRASRRLIAAAEKGGRVLATAEQIRRLAGPRACRWAVCEEKMIGDVRFGDVQMIFSGQLNFADPKFKWRGVRLLTGGGMIMDSGAHFADMMLALFGEPERVWCRTDTLDPVEIDGVPVLGRARADVEDTWLAVLTFAGGVRVAWTYCRVQPGANLRSGRYFGSKGVIEALGPTFHPFQGGGQITLADGTVRPREWIEEQYFASLSADEKARLFPYDTRDGFALEVLDFVRAVTAGGRPELDGLDGLRAKALCMACYESSALGREVDYADVLAWRLDAYERPINEHWHIA